MPDRDGFPMTGVDSSARDRAIEAGARALFDLTRTAQLSPNPDRLWKRLCADGDRPYFDQAEAVLRAGWSSGEAGAPTPGHDVRRVWKGADGRDERGPWEPCPTCGPASSNAGAPDTPPTVAALNAEIETLREHKRSLQNMVIFASEHVAATCAELGLSNEAETETVIKAIRDLRTGDAVRLVPAAATTPTDDEAIRATAFAKVDEYAFEKRSLTNAAKMGVDVALREVRAVLARRTEEGETNGRMAGQARAAEIDRDQASAELARVRAAVTDIADEYERGTEYGTSTVLVQVAARLRETLGVVPGS
jgi:hypothetical protein